MKRNSQEFLRGAWVRTHGEWEGGGGDEPSQSFATHRDPESDGLERSAYVFLVA